MKLKRKQQQQPSGSGTSTSKQWVHDIEMAFLYDIMQPDNSTPNLLDCFTASSQKADQPTQSEVVWKGTSLHGCKTKLERKGDKSGTKARVELEPEKMNFLSDTSPATSKLSRPCTLNSLLVPSESPPPISSQQSMHSSDHSQNLLKVVMDLFSKSRYSDTTIVCEGRLFPAHKVVLAASSGYFNEIFSLLPDKSSVIVLKDISSDMFNKLMKFIYCGEVQIEQSKVMDFLNAASSLKVMGIPLFNLSPNNANNVADEREECGSEQHFHSDGSVLAGTLANKACTSHDDVAKNVPLERKKCGSKRKIPSGGTTLESVPSKKAYTSDDVDTPTVKYTSTNYESQVSENQYKTEFPQITLDESEAKVNSKASVVRYADGPPSVIKNNEDKGSLANAIEECWIKEEFENEFHPLGMQEDISCSSIETF